MYLLRKRLGSDGWQADLILHRLCELVPALTTAELVPLGLGPAAIERLYHAFKLEEVERCLQVSGDLRGTAWWGSALADIGSSTQPTRSAGQVLEEGALFHLGFQLFDIVVDRIPRRKPPLVEALRPELLRQRLLNPGDERHALSCPHEDLGLIVRLFDAGLASAGRRMIHDRYHAEHAYGLLERMYESELRLSPDPFEAKELPAVFIGGLTIVPHSGPPEKLMASLSRFISLCDDWEDLLEDMVRGEPNAFLSSSHTSKQLRVAAYAGRSAIRLLAGRFVHGSIAARLAEPLAEALQTAESLGAQTYAKTLTLCRRSIGRT